VKIDQYIRSQWFGRPNEELQGWVERGRAIREIEDSIGYKLIMTQMDKEIRWAQNQLENTKTDELLQFQMYLKSLRFLKDFILTTERNADISSSVLAGRPTRIGIDSHAFVKNAVPQQEQNASGHN